MSPKLSTSSEIGWARPGDRHVPVVGELAMRNGQRRRTAEVVGVIVFPIALLGVAIYLGAMCAIWLFFAFVLPIVTGVMGPSEVLDAIRARRRTATHHEGEPLPNRVDVRFGIRKEPPTSGPAD